MNMGMRYGMQQHQQPSQMMQQQMPHRYEQIHWFQFPFQLFERFRILFHRQAPPNQMPPNHFMQNPQTTGPNPWWNHPNRYAHSMGGMHQKDNIKPNESGMLNALYMHIVCNEQKKRIFMQSLSILP